jgi:hypothetical protein
MIITPASVMDRIELRTAILPSWRLSRSSSLLALIEISQIRWGLPLLGWHQVAVRAEKIVLFPNGEVVVVL